MSITSIVASLELFFGSQPILLATTTTLMLLRIYLLFKFAIFSLSKTHVRRAHFFLILFLASSIIADSAWIFLLTRDMFIGSMDYRPYLFWLRLAWGALVIQYQALALFLESLILQIKKFSLRQKIFISISSFFVVFAIAIAIIDINCASPEERPRIEFLIRFIQNIYIQFILLPPSLIYTAWYIYRKPLPVIFKKQLKILVLFLIVPIWICDTLQGLPLAGTMTVFWLLNSYAATSLSQILITIASYYCARKVMSLRFLNLQNHVQSLSQSHFVNHFRSTLEQLGYATNLSELKHIVQTFFKESFRINPLEVTLDLRQETSPQQQPSNLEIGDEHHQKKAFVENFIEIHNETLKKRATNLKVFMYDEVAFSNFYENDAHNNIILNFLESIDADLFLPIYEGQRMLAYITVKRHARNGQLYSDVERDEMFIFGCYLGHVINLLKNRNLLATLHQEKTLREELYLKHREINQYKESIRSFIRTHKQKTIGIIFYKNRRFIFGNKAAKELVPININVQEGHPLGKTIRMIATQVEEYKETQSSFAFDKDGNRLVIVGVPSLEKNDVIIMVYHPEISDVIKKQIESLQDPTEWDYLLYLETTHSGKLINQLIPSSGERLMQFKIQLLKAALSNKALLINVADDDLESTVEIIHHISLRETLRTLHLTSLAKNNEIAIAIFGANAIFGMDTKEKPLLEQLDGTGTLHIQNVHFLEVEAQNQLAEFIKYGLYRRFKSDHLHASDVRIICSTNQDLQLLVAEGSFSKTLFNVLQQASLTMPTLMSLSDDELGKLVEGFTEQTLATQDLKNILSLNEREKNRLASTRPVSIQEFKQRVQTLLVQKSKANFIQDDVQFDASYKISDPQLIEAARLGKHALRDPRLMAILWHKFKSQSKIASFLDVNRSSVSRRLKDYGLGN